MTFKVMDEEPNAPLALSTAVAAFWVKRQLKCRRTVGIKLVGG